MSRGLLTSPQLARGIGLAIALAGIAAAQEEPAVTKDHNRQATPGIAGAKKQFESIKSAQDSALLPERGMPRVSLPASPPAQSPGTAASAMKKAKPEPAQATTGNWLVEAMQKQDDRSDPRRDKSTLSDRRGRLRGETDDAAGADSDTPDGARDGPEREDSETPTVVNPLTRYLDDWMTPQDYALLKPGLTSQFDPGAGANNATGLSPAAAGLSGGLSAFALGGVTAPIPVREMPKENPYLHGLRMGTGSPATTVITKPMIAAPVQPRVVHQVPPPALPSPPPARIPDFARPATDEKYFKPLKRF